MPQLTEASMFELDPRALACPHPFYAELRAEAPVTYVEALGAWVVSRYTDVREVLAQVGRFSNRYPTGPKYAALMRESMAGVLAMADAPATAVTAVRRGRWQVLLTADPPHHARQRKLVGRGFTAKQIALAEPQVQAIAERLVDAFVDRGEVELVSELCWPLPLEVIANRLGVPVADMPRFKRWSDDMADLVGNHTHTQDEIVAMLAGQGEFYDYFAARLAEARRAPEENLIGKLATTEPTDEASLSEDEQLGMLAQFLVAGHETTTNLLGMAMLYLARDPGLADRIRSDVTLVPRFVEEVLRLESPAQGMFRLAKEDVTIGGVDIPAGAHVYLVYASANVDDAVFTCPGELDLDRADPSPHLGFGHGAHYCLGAPLARQESRIAIKLMLERMDDIRVADEASVEYNASYFLHGLKRLGLTFTRRS